MTSEDSSRWGLPRRTTAALQTALSLAALGGCAVYTASQIARTGLSLPTSESRRRGRVASRIGRVIAESEVRVVFQPIISTDTGRLVGAEALARFAPIAPAEVADPPDVVFADAASVGLGVDLELLAVRCALLAAEALPTDMYVSINVSPAALLAPGLTDCLLACSLPMRRIVLEVTEHVSVPDYAVLATRAAEIRRLGIRLAVDDAGAGFASFRHILKLCPEYIKLDRTLIEDISEDPARRALAAAVVLFAFEMGSAVVAEGVETVAELRTAQTLGIDAVQGFLLGRPTDDWSTWAEWHSNGPLFRLRATVGA